MQKEYFFIEYAIGGSKAWYGMTERKYETYSQGAARLKSLREQDGGRGIFKYRLVKRMYLDEVLSD